MSKISFVSDGYTLAGNVFMPEVHSSRPAFLFIQGWRGHQGLREAQVLTEHGHATLTYDMRGNGESGGNFADFSRADFLYDATVAYDELRRRVGSAAPIGVVGSSFGGYTGVLLSRERNVSCLSLRVPANYPDEGFDEPQEAQMRSSNDFIEWRQKQLSYTENRALAALHAFVGPVQIVVAENDEAVPKPVTDSYAAAVPSKAQLTYEVLPGAPHRLADERLVADYIRRLVAWVSTV